MQQNKLLVLHSLLFSMLDLATLSLLIYQKLASDDKLNIILLAIAFSVCLIIQQVLLQIEISIEVKFRLQLFTFVGKIIVIWFSSCVTQNFIILYQVLMVSEFNSNKLLIWTFGTMLMINVFVFETITTFQYDQLINLMQIIFISIQQFITSTKLEEKPKTMNSFPQNSSVGLQQQTFAAILESKRSVPVINSLKSNDEEPWLDYKWLFYEKYLVLRKDLKLRYYSFDLNILSKTLETTVNLDKLVDQLLDQSVKFISRIDNSQQSMQCIKGVLSLRQVIDVQHQSEMNYEYYYQTFQMQSQMFDLQKYLINVFGLHGECQTYYILHFQAIPKLAHELNTNIFDMCRSLSHELGTNLNCIQSLSELALQDSTISGPIKIDIIQPILTNSQQLNLIISNIRDYSSIEMDQFQLSLTQFNLRDEIKMIVDFFIPTCLEKQVLIELPFENYLVFNDRDRFRQVIFQLISNAVRFTQTGGIKIEIRYKELSYKIIVTDSGIGMTKQEEFNLKKILQQKLMLRVSQNSIGSSLGLFISNLLVKKMNADDEQMIDFHTQEGGSEFYFSLKNMSEVIDSIQQWHSLRQSKTIIKFPTIGSYFENLNELPLKKPTTTFKTIYSGIFNLEEANQTVYSKEFDENKQTLQPLQSLKPQLWDTIQAYSLKTTCCSRVLIVDDEYFNLLTLEMIMSKFNSKCDKAYNGQEALIQINKKLDTPCLRCLNNCYQLILLDINMPIMGGIETVIEIKRMMNSQIIKKVCVIANTGFSDLETKEKAYDAGIDYFMTKPLNITKFRSIVQKIFPIG